MVFAVLVPTDPKDPPEEVKPGTAILTPKGRRHPLSVFHDPRLSFADRCRAAVARGRRLEVPATEFVEAGLWIESEGVVRLTSRGSGALDRWVGKSLFRNDLEATDSRHNRRMAARQDFRRAVMRGDMAKAARISREHGIHHW